ncbi:MAG: MotA/TolQ/ExbB proton channel family protein [Pirellulales bacterium]
MNRFAPLQLVLVAALFLGVFLVVGLCPSMAWAQENAAAAPVEETASAANMLGWLIRVSGWIGVVILAISFYFVAVVVQQFLELRPAIAAPPEIVEECDRLIQEGNAKDLMKLVEEDESFFSRSLHAGLTELEYSVDEGREKLERTADACTVNMEKKISVLATIGTLGPMIGLLGTLKGMIGSFMAIAISGKNLEASKVAEGISEALVLTFEGVFLSIPAIFFYAFFRNQIAKISVETTMLADDYFRSVVRMLKRPRTPVSKPQAS